MTTICVDLSAGIVISDTKVTSTHRVEFSVGKLFKIPLTRTKTSQWDCDQKALYIHDGVFCGAGDVDNIERLGDVFLGRDVELTKEDMTVCYIRKNYFITWRMRKGVLTKKVSFYNKTEGGKLFFGSGSYWLKKLLDNKKGDVWDTLISYMFLKELDIYTNDKLNLHYI